MEILATERCDFVGYTRLGVNAVASPDVTNAELSAVARRHLRAEDVDAVIVFVWSSPDLVGEQPFDLARVQIARSAARWTGDGHWLLGTAADAMEQVNRFRHERVVIERR